MASENAAAVAPPGLAPDFHQNSDLWPSLIAVSVISLVIMSLAISVRLHAALFRRRSLRLDDCKSTLRFDPSKNSPTTDLCAFAVVCHLNQSCLALKC
jgi:hypothetical protein